MDTLKQGQPPEEYYSTRLGIFLGRVNSARARLKKLAFIRLGIFLLTIILIYFMIPRGFNAIIPLALVGIVAFLFTFKRYVKVQETLRHDESMAEINRNELNALTGDFSRFEDGSGYKDPDHPFTSDLDIFGPGSLFHCFNRSATSLGKNRLADWFRRPLTDGVSIKSRQEAVSEMSEKVEFRQEFLATGYTTKETAEDKEGLIQWINEPPVFSHWKFRLFVILIPILTFTVILLVSLSLLPPISILVYHIVPFGILGIYARTILRKYRILSKKSDIVKKYSGLLAKIENEQFTSGQMESLKNTLRGKDGLPSQATGKLSSILNLFEAHENMIMGYLLNFLFLWDLVMVRRLEKWQALHRDELPRWLDVLGEVDSVCSLANFRFNHPGSLFPELIPDGYTLFAKELCHPLISPDTCVGNPAEILWRRHFIIVSGANMAGKSTYLRTVGVNLVLAMAGSAVVAGEMNFWPVELVTSFLTTDSLRKNESYFYAELKRLKYIIERLEKGDKLLILLDEILKGTNSGDKHSGSKALIEKLLRFGASGMIATHDLSLGELEKSHPGEVVNSSFEVVIENDRLVFDYKLKNGIARQMNATFLMKKMGITD